MKIKKLISKNKGTCKNIKKTKKNKIMIKSNLNLIKFKASWPHQ
jgi:hypothetical protein